MPGPAVRRFILAGFLSLVLPLVQAQVLPFRTYTTRTGLPSNNIRALHQDDQNRLWVGTDNGIAIYDGRTWKILSMVDGLPSNIINDLQPSLRRPGTVWIGTIGGGVAASTGGRCTTVVPGTDNADSVVLSLAETDDGRLWISTVRGVKVMEGDTIRWFRRRPGPDEGAVLARVPGGVAIGQGDSLVIVRGHAVAARRLPLRNGREINCMACSPAGDLWVGASDSTLYLLRDTSLLRSVRLPDRPARIALDADGSLWITGEYSLMRLPSDTSAPPERFQEDNGIPPFVTGPALVDREANVWAGTWFAGLLKLSSRSYRAIAPGSRITGAVAAPGLVFWAGVPGGLLRVRPNGSRSWALRTIPEKQLACGPNPVPLLVDRSGRLWVAGSELDQLFCYTGPAAEGMMPVLLRRFSLLQDFRSRVVTGIFEDRKGRIWLGLVERGVVILDGTTLKVRQILQQSGPVLRDSRVFHEDARGRFWIGDFSGGLSLVEEGPGDSLRYIRTFTIADGLPHDGIRSMAGAPDGALWIGTRLGGIVRYDGTRFSTVSQRDGLRSNAGWALAVGADGRVWAGTDYGVEGIDSRTMQPFQTLKEMQGEKILRMGMAESGVLWAATSYAIHLYDTHGDAPGAVPPPVFITSFLVNGTPQPVADGQSFAYDRNTAAIEFIGVSLKDEEAVRYEYRLGGEDAPWHSTGAQYAVTLAGLPSGRHVFSVRARSGDGTLSAAPAVLTFTITPPFWRTWWFLSGIGTLLVGSVVLRVRRRLQALESARRIQEEFSRRLIQSQEQERKRIAAELHDSLGQNLLIIKNKAELGPDQLADIADIASRSVAEVREIAHDLRPYLLDKLGLTKGLRSMVRRLGDSSGITFTAEIGEIDGFLRPGEEINFYRVVQEATNNVVKHARATTCLVQVEQTGGILRAVVADNGTGLPQAGRTALTEDVGGFGLVGIAERVRLLGGTWSIAPRPGGGTVLTVSIGKPRREAT